LRDGLGFVNKLAGAWGTCRGRMVEHIAMVLMEKN
jgi:hypothetical protein